MPEVPINPCPSPRIDVSTSPKSVQGKKGARSPLAAGKRNKLIRIIIMSLMSLIFLQNSAWASASPVFSNGHSLADLQNLLVRGSPAQKTLASSLLPTLPLDQLLRAATHEHGDVRSEAVTAIAKTGTYKVYKTPQ